MSISLFSNPKPVIGVIHVGALPGTPANNKGIAELVETATREANIYRECGVDGIIVENMHDVPYLKGAVGPEIVAAMSIICRAVKAKSGLHVGVQILAGANIEAMAVAHAADLDFVRAEGYAFAHVADEGIIESCAAKLLRYRKMISADRVQIWADVKKKHSSHTITSDVSLGATVEAVEFMRGDAVIITGNITGNLPKRSDVQEAKTTAKLPVILGSGVDVNNFTDFYLIADGFIVGSHFKANGNWQNEVDKKRVEKFMEAIKRIRGQKKSA